MKKAVAFLLILLMALSCFSCDFSNDESSAESSSTQKSTESTSQSESESKKESESQKESESETEIESSESQSSQTESSTQTSKPALKEYNGFSTTIKATAPAPNRLTQMSVSGNAYDKGSTYTQDKLNSVKSSANLIAMGGTFFKEYQNAGKLISHFLGNSGDVYTIDMNVFLKDANALATRNIELNEALRACEVLAVEGQSITVCQKVEEVHHNLTGDWHYAIGSYFSGVEVKNLTVVGDRYTATIKYSVNDFYNWDESDAEPVFSEFLGTLTKNISPKDLHQLHRAGLAQEFVAHGEITYTISWTKGNTVENMNNLG